ncbi:9502_t:CDS:2 [Paraglomus brasilianum]|uniref:9502_t:CDS:1 n=1 Tax=Paraglomus brasilianum TaxID=144538 RepID=A0A9N8ZQS5_9GLOM|nr:9502_t:CDS:2 [Paraglomus brasilianum]
MALTQSLVDDISRLYGHWEDSDVELVIGEEPEKETFHAHSIILRARSPYFRAAFSSTWEIKDNGKHVFSKPNIKPNTFREILKYIYTAEVTLDPNDNSEVLDLFIAADELALSVLFNNIQDYIMTNRDEWVQENLAKLLRTTSRLDSSSQKLFEHCQRVISRSPELIFQTDDFCTLEPEVLLSLIKRNDLAMNEINIWEHVIKWGRSQPPALDPDVTKWSSEDFKTLEERIRDFIPHIRFFEISGADYHYKVRPYKKILPRDLKDDIKLHHFAGQPPLKTPLLPSRVPAKTVDSILIDSNQIALIASWVDRKDTKDFQYAFRTIPYHFDLLLRGSRDGMQIQNFREKCNEKSNLVVVIKTSNGQLIGGYNPLHWSSSNAYHETNSSFIFSLGDGAGSGKVILSRVADHTCAICDPSSKFLNVGFGCGDLLIFQGKCRRNSYAREIIKDSECFTLEDYEVFQVKKDRRENCLGV